jgi:hypothetical protein
MGQNLQYPVSSVFAFFRPIVVPFVSFRAMLVVEVVRQTVGAAFAVLIVMALSAVAHNHGPHRAALVCPHVPLPPYVYEQVSTVSMAANNFIP